MRKKLKEFIKGLIGIWIVFILFFVPILCLGGEYKAALIMALIVTIMFGSILLAVIIGNKVNLFSKKKNIRKKFEKYQREIPKEYTVSMASLLLDSLTLYLKLSCNNLVLQLGHFTSMYPFLYHSIRHFAWKICIHAFEEIVDIPATILSLIGKNILIYENNKLSVQHIEELSNLFEHEKYVYECIKEKKKIQPNKFRVNVINDALRFKYIKKNDVKDPFKKAILIFLALMILTFVCSIRLIGFPKVLYYSIIVILFICTITSPIAVFNKHELDIDNPYKNTRLGNKEIKRLMGLKKYLKEFSLIDKKKIKEVIIWEDYLAYAYMFGINKKIFEEFKELKQINNIV